MKADPKGDAPSASKKKMMVMIIAGLLILGLAGGTAYFMTRPSKDKPEAEHKKKEVSAEPAFVKIDSFTVNLQPENGAEQYLQIEFQLQVGDLLEVDVFKKNMPKARSRLLLLLSGKRASEINTVDGKRALATEIIAVMKQPFADKGEPQTVTDVLFTNFIIQ
jgi:flagellar FliL protein